ncbi:hypothetical protein PS15p_207089 [Mucor circinelloides]
MFKRHQEVIPLNRQVRRYCNKLFIFGIQCSGDHPSRSLIMNPYEKNYTLYDIFARKTLNSNCV